MGQLVVQLHDVVVGGREHLLREAFPRLGDVGHLGAGGVFDAEVPGAPVLGFDRADRRAAGLRSKRILPNTFSCTMRPSSEPAPSATTIVDLNIFAGRVSRRSTVPDGSVISNRWVMNWSMLVSARSTFFAALWPTSFTLAT